MSAASARLVLVLAVAGLAEAAGAGGPGTTSGDGLLLPAAARPEGMGGAYVGVGEGPAALFWNPAGLADLDEPQASVLATDYFADASYQVLTYAGPTGRVSGFAAGARILTYGSSPRTSVGADGMPAGMAGSLNATDAALTAGWGTRLPRMLGISRLRAGIAVECIYQSQTGAHATGLGGTAGLLWDTPVPRLRAGLVASDLGTAFDRASLPANGRLGLSWTLPIEEGWRVLWVADGRVAADAPAEVRAGAEVIALERIALRGGWHGAQGLAGGPTFGAGFSLPPRWLGGRIHARLDYAGEMAGDFGMVHRIELSAAFGDGVTRAARAARASRDAMVDSAKLKVNPPRTGGSPGTAVKLTGQGFPANVTLIVTINGVQVAPPRVGTDETGALIPASVALTRPLPAGRFVVMMDTGDGARPFAFDDAIEIRPSVLLNVTGTESGKGTAGTTTFILEGTGLQANAYVPADSVRVGRYPTRHSPIKTDADGVLAPTRISIRGALPPGHHDIVVPVGSPLTFASSFQVDSRLAAEIERENTKSEGRDADLAVSAVRSIETARTGIDRLVRSGGDRLVPKDIESLSGELKAADDDLRGGRYEDGDKRARKVLERLGELGQRVDGARRGEFIAYANVLAAGFDSRDPGAGPGASGTPPGVVMGRRVLADARAAIAAGKLDEAKALLKAAAELLRKTHQASGASGMAVEPPRW